jgi:adenylate cyclase
VAREIERKFLVPAVPGEVARARSEEIEQGYLVVSPRSEVRLRSIGDRRVLTLKRGSGSERIEVEIELSEAQFGALWGATEGARVTKRRFYDPIGDAMAEIDVYGGQLDGLITAEVEFESSEQAEAFDPPPWFGAEVTEDHRYANQALAAAAQPPHTESQVPPARSGR